MKKLLFVLVAGMFLLAAGFGVFLRPLLYTLTPLQRYYLSAYLASSWHETDPAATSEIQWIWKFKPAAGSKKSKPNLQYALATEDDLLPIPARELLWKGDILPFWMNRKAEVDGWTGIERGLPAEVNAAKLAALLRQEFFYGEPVWHSFTACRYARRCLASLVSDPVVAERSPGAVSVGKAGSAMARAGAESAQLGRWLQEECPDATGTTSLCPEASD